MGISCSDTMNDWSQFLCRLPDKEMDMVCHQAICVEITSRGKLFPYIINWMNHVPKDVQEANRILILLKNVLPVSTSHHHVIDACSTDFS